MIRHPAVLIVGLLAVLPLGCEQATSPVPPEVQELHVVVTQTEVTELRLTPAIVHAGDVYVVMDVPGSTVGFAWAAHTAAEPGSGLEMTPMTDADLARFARGGMEGSGVSTFDNRVCSNAPHREDVMGPCGNVQKVVLAVGKYAFFLSNPGTETPGLISVLEVVP